MGQSINSGNVSGEVNAVISGSLVSTINTPAVPSATQTLVHISGTANGSAQDAYTVTAGKTFYLYGGTGPSGAYSINIFKNDGSTKVMRIDGTANTPVVCISSTTPIWAYTEGQIVKVNGTNNGYYMLWGIEQ